MTDQSKKKVSELTEKEMQDILLGQAEASVELTARWLGITERMVTNYCRAQQLRAEKVGKKWFIKSESVLAKRGVDQRLEDVILPELENPLSRKQEERKGGGSAKPWELKKGPKRNPRKLNCYSRLEECFALLKSLEQDIPSEDFAFFRQELLELGDDLGAGYYSFGPTKRRLYERARLRAGRLVSRALLRKQPDGIVNSLAHVVEGISFLCRRMDKARAA